MAKKASWWSKCAICGCTFPIWGVSKVEWDAGGFKRKHVCKKCFETKVPNPHYYSVDEYLDDNTDTVEIVQKHNPDLTPADVKRVALDMRIKLRVELVRVWDK